MKKRAQIQKRLIKKQNEFNRLEAEFKEKDKYFTDRCGKNRLKKKMLRLAHEILELMWVLKK